MIYSISIRMSENKIKMSIDSFLSEKIKDFNDFILSKECNKKPSDEELKVYIIKKSVFPHICSVCKLEPFWNKKPLDFLLDRKNNNLFDNSVENLRFLCPNCFSQIKKKKTIFKKSVKSDGILCKKCNKRIKYKTNRFKNVSCFEEFCTNCKTQDKLKKMFNKGNTCKEI